jgi:hypothetical protein
MPTCFSRGPPNNACGRSRSAYSESRHSVPYADIGIGYDVVVICEELATDSASPVLLDDLAIQ